MKSRYRLPIPISSTVLWKSNLALDYKWRGWVFTLEALYTKDVNAIYHDNIGIEVAEGKSVNVAARVNALPSPVIIWRIIPTTS